MVSYRSGVYAMQVSIRLSFFIAALTAQIARPICIALAGQLKQSEQQ